MSNILDFLSRRRGSDYLAFLILAAGMWIRFDAIGFQSLWLDEYVSIKDSASLRSAARSYHSPGYFLLLNLWQTAFGGSIESGRALSACADSMTMLMVFLLAARYFGRNVATCALFLYAFAPMSVWYARELRMYSFWGFTCLGAVYFLQTFLEGRGSKVQLVAFWLLSFAAFGSHYYSVFFLGSLAVGATLALWCAVRDRELTPADAMRRLFSLFFVFPLAGIFIIILKWDRFGGSLSKVIRTVAQSAWSELPVTIGHLPSSMVYFYFWGTESLGTWSQNASHYVLIPLLVSGIVLMVMDTKVSKQKKIIFLCYAVLPFVVINTIGIKNYDRLFYPFLAVMMIVLAYLIARTANVLGRTYRSYAVCAAGLLLAFSWWPQLDQVLYQPVYPLKQACGDVKYQRKNGDVIAATAPYTAQLVSMVCGFRDAILPFKVSGGQIEGNTGVQKLAGHERVWIFFTHNWGGDPDFASIRYLNKQGYQVFYHREYSGILRLVGLRRMGTRPATVETAVPQTKGRARL